MTQPIRKARGKSRLRAHIIDSDVVTVEVGATMTFKVSPHPDLRKTDGKHSRTLRVHITDAQEVPSTFTDGVSRHWEIWGVLQDDCSLVHGGRSLNLRTGDAVRGELFVRAPNESLEEEGAARTPSIHGWLLEKRAAEEMIAANNLSNARADDWWARQQPAGGVDAPREGEPV